MSAESSSAFCLLHSGNAGKCRGRATSRVTLSLSPFTPQSSAETPARCLQQSLNEREAASPPPHSFGVVLRLLALALALCLNGLNDAGSNHQARRSFCSLCGWARETYKKRSRCGHTLSTLRFLLCPLPLFWTWSSLRWRRVPSFVVLFYCLAFNCLLACHLRQPPGLRSWYSSGHRWTYLASTTLREAGGIFQVRCLPRRPSFID